MDAFIVRRADRIIAVSEKIARQMRGAGIKSKKICVIENGVDLDRFVGNAASNSVRESLRIKKDVPVVGTVGALTKEKGHMYFLNAASKVNRVFPEAVFLFVGDGRERPNLEKATSYLGIQDNVIFAGMRKDVPEILSILDVFVLPSLIEGLPMALLEAQAAKVPVIATRVGAIPNVIEDGVTGVVVRPKDPEAITEAVIQILCDRKIATKMAERGFERVRDKFSADKMADKYLSLYKELLS
jgi:glycosyltransferase involved in cell wall biosynthesis